MIKPNFINLLLLRHFLLLLRHHPVRPSNPLPIPTSHHPLPVELLHQPKSSGSHVTVRNQPAWSSPVADYPFWCRTEVDREHHPNHLRINKEKVENSIKCENPLELGWRIQNQNGRDQSVFVLFLYCEITIKFVSSASVRLMTIVILVPVTVLRSLISSATWHLGS